MLIENWGYYLWPLQADYELSFTYINNREFPVNEEEPHSFITTESTPIISWPQSGSEVYFQFPVIYTRSGRTINPDPDLKNGLLYVTYLDASDNNQLLGETVTLEGGTSVTIDANAFLDQDTPGSGTQFTCAIDLSTLVTSVGKFQPVT